jgi:hypothetical protein
MQVRADVILRIEATNHENQKPLDFIQLGLEKLEKHIETVETHALEINNSEGGEWFERTLFNGKHLIIGPKQDL